MRKIYQSLIFVFLFMPLSSCSHYFYSPNAHNVPLFQEKGEVRASAGIGFLETRDIDFQTAYAFTEHLGLMVNGFNVPYRKYSDSSNNGKGYLIEGGTGYFTNINEKWVYETYAGYGAGNVQNIFYDYTYATTEDMYAGHSVMNIHRFFVQLSLGYTTAEFDCAFTCRFSRIHYSNIRLYDTRPDFEYAEDFKLMREKSFYQYEPGFTIRAGWKYIKAQGQFGFSMNMNEQAFRVGGSAIRIGLYLSLAEKFKTHK